MSVHKSLQPFETELLDLASGSTPTAERHAQAAALRVQLQTALDAHQETVHRLLTDNYAAVATQIRHVRELQTDTGQLLGRLAELDQSFRASNERVPRIVPALLSRCAASHTRAQGRGRLDALRRARDDTRRLEALEAAVWAGRGADADVLDELVAGPSGSTDGVSATLREHKAYLRTVVAEQVATAFAHAVSFSTATEHTISVRPAVELQRTYNQKRMFGTDAAPPGDRPQYALARLYEAMGALGSLASAHASLHSRILRDFVRPLAARDAAVRVETSATPHLQLLRLERAGTGFTPRAAVDAVAALLSFVAEHVVPAPAAVVVPAPRDAFPAGLARAAFRGVLNDIVLPAMPADVAALDEWTALVAHAKEAEAALSGRDAATGKGVVAEFQEAAMGSAWRAARDRRLFEQLREVVRDRWRSWEAEIRTYVPLLPEQAATLVTADELENDEAGVPQGEAIQIEGEDDGWGFDGEDAEGEAAAGTAADPIIIDEQPTSDATAAADGDGDGEGWDFDDVAALAVAPAPALVPAKPIRQAKRLGKKVERAEADSGTTMDANADNGWAFDAPVSSVAAVPSKPVREAKRLGKKVDKVAEAEHAPAYAEALVVGQLEPAVPQERTEVYTVSKACDALLALVRAYQGDLAQLSDRHALSGSAKPDTDAATAAALDCFAALVLAEYEGALEQPARAMQLHNDLHYIAAQLADAGEHAVTNAGLGPAAALVRLGTDVLASLVEREQRALDAHLDAADALSYTADDARFRRAEKAVGHVAARLGAVAAGLKPVARADAYAAVLGALVEHVLRRLVGHVTALQDIEELESNRLADLLGSLLRLSTLFSESNPGVIAIHVPVWLKFNYLIELLRANLVDITYLFETRALVDFAPDELAGLVRALFADSPKRAAVIDQIMGV